MPLLAEWWPELIDHEEQSRLWWSDARHRVVAAGRGAGKSESAARIILSGDEHHRGAINAPEVAAPLYVIAAPTRDQVKSIWWNKIKMMTPVEWLAKDPSESELTITLKNVATIRLVGLDKPYRTEGVAIDGLVVDEYAEVKASAWASSLEPACNRRGRPGWALFIGRPKGRGHFYDRWTSAKTASEWDSFHWTSEPVLGAEALERIRENCDELTYRQEYLADWVTFEGLAYHAWNPNLHYRQLSYDPNRPLIFCFDFNVSPGVAAVLQEQDLLPIGATEGDRLQTTCAIAEVHIPDNSTTEAVCRRLSRDWGHHQGDVLLYGDATGGRRQTVSSDGATDWVVVKQVLRQTFDDRIRDRVKRSNPNPRDRINSVNNRLKTTSGTVRFAADPRHCKNIIKDFEGVALLEGGSGEVDKKGAEAQGLSHLSEAIGYYIHERHPIQSGGMVVY